MAKQAELSGVGFSTEILLSAERNLGARFDADVGVLTQFWLSAISPLVFVQAAAAEALHFIVVLPGVIFVHCSCIGITLWREPRISCWEQYADNSQISPESGEKRFNSCWVARVSSQSGASSQKTMLWPSVLAVQSGFWPTLYVSTQQEACFPLERFSLGTNGGRISPLFEWNSRLTCGAKVVLLGPTRQLFTALFFFFQSLLFCVFKCFYCNRQIKSLQRHT